MLANRNKRKGDRYATARDIAIAIEGEDAAYPAVLMDVSPTGFKAQVESDIAVGTLIALHVPGFADMPARTMWCRDGLIGCEFVDKLTRHAVLAMARSGMFGSTSSPSA